MRVTTMQHLQVIDVFFVVDIAVNFRTGYTDMQGKVGSCPSDNEAWFICGFCR